MRSLALLVVLAGCNFRLNKAGAVGDDAGGDGATTGDDATIDTPAGDGDGDGVPDNLDNCPSVSNADQRDHDSDGRGDVCDLCPHIAEATDVDNDGDGIGDACDPRPTQAGDTRVLWVGFYDANDVTGWTASTTYTVALGRLTFGDVTNGLAYLYPPTQYQRAFAQTSVRVDTLAAAVTNVSPGALLYTGDMGMPQYYLCDLATTATGNKVYALDSYPNNQNHLDNQSWPGTFAAGSEAMLTDEVIGNNHSCNVTQGGTSVPITQNAGSTQGVTVLAASYANLSFDYLFVVEVGS